MFTQFHKPVFSALSCSMLLTGVCLAQTTERVSVDSLGVQGNGYSGGDSSFSVDGRYVAFSSQADNLVPGDTNGAGDVFLRDRQTGVIELVSVDSFGIQGNHGSGNLSISPDGRYVAFQSEANNLVTGDTNWHSDIFVHDRQTGVTERVSVDSLGVQANSDSYFPSISADGRYVAFHSHALNLVIGNTNVYDDIFVHDRQTGVTERVSVDSLGNQANHQSRNSSLSANGRYVAFWSFASNLVIGDTNAQADAFVHDRQTGITERVSVDALGTQGNNASHFPSISPDGRYVVFESWASNFVLGDINGAGDIFVHDRQTGMMELVSVDSLGIQAANHSSQSPSISSNGRYVAFFSQASNLVPADTNARGDIFVHDRQTSVTERVSVDSFGAQGNDHCLLLPSISADGRLVAFDSWASNLVPGDTNGTIDTFVYDRWSGLGENSIYLAGPTTSQVLTPMDLSWYTTRGNSQYWLAYSLNRNGAVVRGHNFDIGNPMTVLATGTNSANGMGSFTSASVPSGAAGLTLYFEVAARDAAGVLYDSNVHAVTFY